MPEKKPGWGVRIKDFLQGFVMPITLVFLILLFLAVYFSPRILISIGSGEAGVLYRRFHGGTQVDRIYGEGLHVIKPWDKMFIYDTRVQNVMHEFGVLTKEGLRIELTLSIRYQPDRAMLGMLQQRVGPDYVQRIVVPEVESAIRTLAGNYSVIEIYTTQRALLSRILGKAIEEIQQNFVDVNDVIIREIRLPAKIRNVIEYKVEQRELAAAYDFKIDQEKKEALRKSIEAGGYKAYNDTLARTLTGSILKWKAIEATRDIAKSQNTKIVVMGNGSGSLPVLLDGGDGRNNVAPKDTGRSPPSRSP